MIQAFKKPQTHNCVNDVAKRVLDVFFGFFRPLPIWLKNFSDRFGSGLFVASAPFNSGKVLRIACFRSCFLVVDKIKGAFFPLHMASLEASSKPEIVNSCHKSELLDLWLRLAFFLYCTGNQKPL